MKKPPLDPDVADIAPAGPLLTAYDEEHVVTYVRLLDADAEGADWREVSRIVLHIDPDDDAERARRAFDSHLSRAKWVEDRISATVAGWRIAQPLTVQRCRRLSRELQVLRGEMPARRRDPDEVERDVLLSMAL